MMENGHGRRLCKFPGIMDKSHINCTRGYFCVYVNQDNNSPILWRFSACPAPPFCSDRVNRPQAPDCLGSFRRVWYPLAEAPVHRNPKGGTQMKEYDVVVVGSGAGALVVQDALAHNFSVALVDKGPLGGTCLNLGCIPSKMLIYPADRIVEIGEAERLGVTAEIRAIDFRAIMERMRATVRRGEGHMREGIRYSEGLDFYEGEAHFVKDYTLEVRGDRIRGKRIFIASGARPSFPAVRGLDSVEFVTNESALRIEEKPGSILIVGGGYVAAEYAHFFSAMGVKVTLLQRNERLVPEEEPEISELLKKVMSRRIAVHTHMEATEVKKQGRLIAVTGREKTTGKESEFSAEQLMVAAGRKSNADLLKVENTGIETDERNYIKVNEYFETSRKNIWAFGDAIGRKMFRHVANREASVVWNNAAHKRREKVDYLAAPHAVFAHPEIASVGLTEAEARKRYRDRDLLIGRADYSEVARGEAMLEKDGFAKAIVRKESEKVLGFHIIGPHASILIQEVILAMANDLNIWQLAAGMHIHPALPEIVIATLGNLREIE
jgi:mycothione reductase